MNINNILSATFIGVFAMIVASGGAFAGHNGAVVTEDVNTCEPTTISATIADPDGTHIVSNMWLTVDDGDSVQTDIIPVDGSNLNFEVGPFGSDKTVSWNVFGGGERSYDQPLWNGFGTASFSADIGDYAADVGGFSWVIAGVDDPNPFVNWNEVEVTGCAPEAKDECKDGGWAGFGFRNQGQCIRFVNTGQDSR